MAGVQVGGTSSWSKPVTVVPIFFGNHGPVFISGTASPTLATVQLALARRVAIQSLASSYAATLATGITVTSGSLTVTLAAQPSDQQQFNELLTLLNTAPMPPTLTITDITGNPHTVTVAQYYSLVGSYGQQIAALLNALITAKASVASVSGTAALQQITLTDPTGE